MNEEDVPPGEWLCPRCRTINEIKRINEKHSMSRNAISRNEFKQAHHDRTRNSLDRGKNNNHFEYSESNRKIRRLFHLYERCNPLADLVKISLLLNPKEYELPEDYVPDIQFPGSSKKQMVNSSSREARLSSYSVRRAQELDRDNLPSILRTCYLCRKGWRKAPLINCDYCPLIYHADCIDPPLTNIPSTRWMCPNHVEPIAEEKLLNSSSFSERVKLWSQFSKPIDHESVKTDFLFKILGYNNDNSKNSELSDSGIAKNGYQSTSRSIPETEKDDYEHIDSSNGLIIDISNETSYRSHLEEAFNKMIESSKILDILDESPQINGDDEDIVAGPSSQHDDINGLIDNEKNSEEKQEWIEFLIKLANNDTILKQETNDNSNKQYEIFVKEYQNQSLQQNQIEHNLDGNVIQNRDCHNQKIWTNNILAPKNRNTDCSSNDDPQLNNESMSKSKCINIVMRNKQP